MSKEYFINTLKIDEELQDFFMVKSISLRIGANQKQYLDVTLGDATGEINGKKWDVNDDEAIGLSSIKEGDLVKVRATVTEWNGTKQLKVTKIRKGQKEDKCDIRDYVKAAPEEPESMYEYVCEKARSIGDEDLRKMALMFLEREKERLMYYPAAMRNHHAELAGLLYHLRRMLAMGEKVCEVYSQLDRDWVLCGVILHDMEKINEIRSDEYGISPGYTLEGQLLGHLAQGVAKIGTMAAEAGISAEKTVMLQHMILSHHYEPEFGSPKRPMFAEAEVLHYLDMIDAKMFDFEAALSGVDPGSFSERVRTLDSRMLYKPSFIDESAE